MDEGIALSVTNRAWDQTMNPAEDDLLAQLRRVDVTECHRVVFGGPPELVAIAVAFARAMAPAHVSVGAGTAVTMTQPVDATVRQVLTRLGLRPDSGEIPVFGPGQAGDIVLSIDTPLAERPTGAIALTVGDPADLTASLGVLPRGPALKPGDRGSDDEQTRWMFAAGWLRDICQALFARSDRPWSDTEAEEMP